MNFGRVELGYRKPLAINPLRVRSNDTFIII
jgi:hypothetical protein